MDSPTNSPVLGYPVAAIGITQAISLLLRHSAEKQACRVYLANVHMLMEAQQSADLHKALLDANLLLPDGRPLCWWQRLVNNVIGEQIRGYDLVMTLLQHAQQQQLKVAFYGGHSERALTQLIQVVAVQFPQLKIVYQYSPPFAPIAVLEPLQQQLLADSQADILLVGLGCPKQELFIQQYSAQLPPVQIGVGAVFDFISGRRALPPRWAAACGLEWLFRWIQEPRRLTRRYMRYNPLFIARFLQAWMSKQ